MPTPMTGTPKGVFSIHERDQSLQLSRYIPSEDLQPFVELYWILEWDPEDNFHKQEILPQPSVQLVFEKNNTWIWGVVTGQFKRLLKGKGRALGVKFKPGGFYPFFQSSVSEISDGVVAFNEVFDADVTELEEHILTAKNKEASIDRTERFLRKNMPDEDERIQQVNDIVDTVIEDKSIIKVEQLAERVDLNKKKLHRLFKWYVGVPPKWLIKRFRIQEVAEKIAREEQETDWAKLALGLGYYDQWEFIQDFKSIVGQTPAELEQSTNR